MASDEISASYKRGLDQLSHLVTDHLLVDLSGIVIEYLGTTETRWRMKLQMEYMDKYRMVFSLQPIAIRGGHISVMEEPPRAYDLDCWTNWPAPPIKMMGSTVHDNGAYGHAYGHDMQGTVVNVVVSETARGRWCFAHVARRIYRIDLTSITETSVDVPRPCVPWLGANQLCGHLFVDDPRNLLVMCSLGHSVWERQLTPWLSNSPWSQRSIGSSTLHLHPNDVANVRTTIVNRDILLCTTTSVDMYDLDLGRWNLRAHSVGAQHRLHGQCLEVVIPVPALNAFLTVTQGNRQQHRHVIMIDCDTLEPVRDWSIRTSCCGSWVVSGWYDVLFNLLYLVHRTALGEYQIECAVPTHHGVTLASVKCGAEASNLTV